VFDAYDEDVLGSNVYREQTIILNELGVPSFELSGLYVTFTEESRLCPSIKPQDQMGLQEGFTKFVGHL
jgi:hypothetical protein